MNTLSTHLINMMFFTTFLILTGGAKALYVAWYGRETAMWSRLVATQRLRYSLIVFSCLISAGFSYGLLARYGWNSYHAGIQEWKSSGSLIGTIVGYSMWYAIFSPVMGLLAAIHVYRQPSQMAKRVRGGWVSTQDVRSRTSTQIIYRKYAFANERVLDGAFVPVGVRP